MGFGHWFVGKKPDPHWWLRIISVDEEGYSGGSAEPIAEMGIKDAVGTWRALF